MRSTASRLLSLLLALLLTAGAALGIPASADDDPAVPEAPGFSDAAEGAWYCEAVRYVTALGLFSGTSADTFSPKAPMDRAMAVTVLWKLAGAPEAGSEPPFTDVSPRAYYVGPVGWAAEHGIVSGVSADRFCPHSPVTRQQLALMLLRFAEDRSAAAGGAAELEVYPDADEISRFARSAMAWALDRGILRGSSEHGGILYLNPKSTVTRAEAAVMLMQLHRRLLQEEPPERPEVQETPASDETTRLWVEGAAFEACPVWNGLAYISLPALSEALGEGFLAGDNLRISALGRTAYLCPDKGAVVVDGKAAALDAPCLLCEGVWYAPADSLLTAMGQGGLADPARNQSYYSHMPKYDEIPDGAEIVILRCHGVSDEVWGDDNLFLSPSKLEELLAAMEDLGCSFLTFEDLDRIDQYERPVFLTFDDGYRDNYLNLFPILQRHNAKATIFMVSKYINTGRSLTAEQIQEMAESGLVSIQSHTAGHKNMDELTPEELEYECAFSQRTIARLTHRVPFVLSFPRARANEAAMTAAARHYRFAVIADGSPWVTGTDPYRIPRCPMPRDISLEQFLSYFPYWEPEAPEPGEPEPGEQPEP